MKLISLAGEPCNIQPLHSSSLNLKYTEVTFVLLHPRKPMLISAWQITREAGRGIHTFLITTEEVTPNATVLLHS